MKRLLAAYRKFIRSTEIDHALKTINTSDPVLAIDLYQAAARRCAALALKPELLCQHTMAKKRRDSPPPKVPNSLLG